MKRYIILFTVILLVLSACSDDTRTTFKAEAPPSNAAVKAVEHESNPPEPSTSTSPKEPDYPTFQMKEDATAGKFIYNIDAVLIESRIEFDYTKLITNDQFVVLKIKITNDDDRARDISSHAFTLLDAKGRKYDAYDPPGPFDSEVILYYETINPGLSRTRMLLFETPKGIDGLKLRADSGVALAGGEIVEINLD